MILFHHQNKVRGEPKLQLGKLFFRLKNKKLRNAVSIFDIICTDLKTVYHIILLLPTSHSQTKLKLVLP